MTIYFVDGQFTDKDGVRISIDDRGYYFGDGVYEVVKVYNGELFTAQEHMSRLLESASKVKMAVPYTEQQLIGIAEELMKKNDIDTGHVYLQVTRGASARVHHFPDMSVAPVVTGYAIDNARPLLNLQEGVAAKTVEDIRWLRCDIKSLNLLGNVMAKQEAHEAGCVEAIFIRDGIVMEGSSSNMFGIRNGIVYTHPATNLILNGITRKVILNICSELEIQVLEKEFTLEELYLMDEFIMTSTTAEVTPVITIDNKKIGSGVPGPITKKLQEAFAKKLPLTITGK